MQSLTAEAVDVRNVDVAEPKARFRRPPAILLLLLSVALYFGTAFSPALLDDADASHAVVSREMLQRGDYVVLFMNGVRYLMKAPLHYWLVAASYAVFGESEFSTRLPVVLAMVGLVLLAYEFGRRFFSERAGLYAGLVLCTSMGMFIFTRIMIPEAIYALEFTAAFYLFLRAWTGSLSPRTGYWGAAVMMALAVLTRGVIGLLFPAGAIFFFITLTGGWHRWRELRLFSSAAIFFVIATPWHVLAELRAPGFLWSYFINEHVNRALGTRYPPDYDAVPLAVWWVAHLAWFFPWSVFLPFALRQLSPLKRWRGRLATNEQAHLLLFTWAALIFAFFSVIGGSRMEYYAFGAWPAVAILIGSGLANAEERISRWLSRAYAALALLGIAVAALLGAMVWMSRQVTQNGDFSSLLQSHPNDFYRLSMSHLLDLTPAAFAALRSPALLAAFSVGVAFTVAWVLARRVRYPMAALAVAAGMAGMFFAANQAYGIFEPRMSSHNLAIEMNKYLQASDRVCVYGDFDGGSSIAFYTHRKVCLYNGRENTNLDFGSHFPDSASVFLDDAGFPALWNGPARVFLFVPPELHDQAVSRLPANATWIFAESNEKVVYVNRPVRDDEQTLASYSQARAARAGH